MDPPLPSISGYSQAEAADAEVWIVYLSHTLLFSEKMIIEKREIN